MAAPRKKRTRNYVNNREMFETLKRYLVDCKEAEAAGKQYPEIPRYLAECFTQIADRLGTKSNFSGYSYLEDMKSDGKINCITYIRNFNPEKSNNPFAYFTQIIKFAFIRRIQMEQKQTYVKLKNYQNMQIVDDIDGVEGSGATELNEISNDWIDSYEKKMLTNRRKSDKVKASNTTPANTVTDLME